MAVSHSFKRVVLGLRPSVPDRAMQLAVELADLLHLELLGLFLEDTGLRHLAAIPFARELRLLGGGWHPIDLDQLSRDLELAARSMERMFADAAKGLPTRYQFEVIRTPTAEAIASVSRTGDIVMIMEPLSPAEQATQQFSHLMEAAFRSAGAVMLVPTRIARATGPIVAIAAARDDPSIESAAAIAMATEEALVIVEASEGAADDPRVARLAADTGLRVKRIVVGNVPALSPSVLLSAFRELRERLVIISRGALDREVALTMASARRVPVLVIEPPEPTDANAILQPQTASHDRSH